MPNPKSCKTKKDNRVWPLYNESLVKRMENLLDLRAIENIKEDLAKQNRNKVGRPFRLPDSIVEIFARIRSVFNAPFRVLESLLRKMSDLLGIPKITYSALYLRIRKIKVPEICNPSASVAIDSTGFKTTIRGDWLSDKWGKKRKGWIKLHASVDIKHVNAQKIAITSAHMHDSQILPLLVTGNEDQIFADKAYDSRKIFNLLDSNGTNAIIPLRKNFRTTARGSPLRHRIARQIRNMGEEQWKENNNYGRRWIVEIYFSGLKRVMGEVIKARKLECVIQEIGLKVLYYNYLRNDTRAYG